MTYFCLILKVFITKPIEMAMLNYSNQKWDAWGLSKFKYQELKLNYLCSNQDLLNTPIHLDLFHR